LPHYLSLLGTRKQKEEKMRAETLKRRERLALAITILALSACSAQEPETAPIAVKQFGPDWTGLTSVTVIATADKVTVTSIKANRGNCADPGGAASQANQLLQEKKPLPTVLKFGDKQARMFACEVIEVEVGTTQGTWVFAPKNGPL
jgi:hypothetical protein